MRNFWGNHLFYILERGNEYPFEVLKPESLRYDIKSIVEEMFKNYNH